MGKVVELMMCTNSFEAEVIKGRLEAEGIPVMVTGENNPYHMGLSYSTFSPRVLIDEDYMEQAKALLEDIEG